MSRKNKVKIFKIIMMIIALVLIVGVATYLVPVMANLSTVEGQLEFKEKVSSSRHIRTSYIIWHFNFAQIFLIILPGEPIEY